MEARSFPLALPSESQEQAVMRRDKPLRACFRRKLEVCSRLSLASAWRHSTIDGKGMRSKLELKQLSVNLISVLFLRSIASKEYLFIFTDCKATTPLPTCAVLELFHQSQLSAAGAPLTTPTHIPAVEDKCCQLLGSLHLAVVEALFMIEIKR